MIICQLLVILAAAAPSGVGQKLIFATDSRQQPVACELDRDFEAFSAGDQTRILLIGGLDGAAEASSQLRSAWSSWLAGDEERRKRFQIALIELPQTEENLADGYPPKETAYQLDGRPLAVGLWRWIGILAPDLVVDVRQGAEPAAVYTTDEALKRLWPAAETDVQETELVAAVTRVAPASVGTVPAVRLAVPKDAKNWLEETLLGAIESSDGISSSPARQEMKARLQRSPLEVAEQLAKVYGHSMNAVSYIPALAMVGRLQLAERTGRDETVDDVARILAPFVTGEKTTLSNTGGTPVSGHLVFAAMFERTEDPRYLELVRKAADLGFENGAMKASMPSHNEMSDSVFMGCAILARAGRLTGERRYYDMCARHLEFMKELTFRDDGLYRHSPLDDAAWGRGNGFPALGLAMSLTDMPTDHPAFASMLADYRTHMEALVAWQDPTGHWRQTIDDHAYREYTCTCMVTFAMARGIQKGWLDRQRYLPVVERAWKAILRYTGSDGGLIDVCTGTGKQPDLTAYFNRTAILGRDDRGGAMGLLAALELAALKVRSDEK